MRLLLKRAFPDLHLRLSWWWWTFRSGSHITTRRVARLLTQFGDTSIRVQHGPFSGMKYPADLRRQQVCGTVHGSLLLPKIVGSYESELHPALSELLTRDYDAIIDVGGAAGYYAVGLALRLTRATIHAFDASPQSRQLCEAMARLNDVTSHVIIGEYCDASTIQGLAKGRTLVVVDCEGNEATLLDRVLAPCLADCDVLVELHEALAPDIKSVLISRFSESHQIRLFYRVARRPADWPCLASLTPVDQEVALTEFRTPGVSWAWMQAKRYATADGSHQVASQGH